MRTVYYRKEIQSIYLKTFVVDKGNGSDKTNGNKVSADGKKNSQTQAVTQAKSVKTGDTADLALWMTMLVLSFGAGLSIVQLTKKRERQGCNLQGKRVNLIK